MGGGEEGCHFEADGWDLRRQGDGREVQNSSFEVSSSSNSTDLGCPSLLGPNVSGSKGNGLGTLKMCVLKEKPIGPGTVSGLVEKD